MGRDRKCLDMNGHHFTKEELEERRRSERAYKVNQDQLKPPEYLSDSAKAEFERIKGQAFWLDNLDLNDLTLYVFCCDRLTEILKAYGEVDEEGNPTMPPEVIEMQSEGGSKLVANPIRKAIRDYHSEIRKLSAKLGIATVDRLKLVAPAKAEKKNKFEQFLR